MKSVYFARSPLTKSVYFDRSSLLKLVCSGLSSLLKLVCGGRSSLIEPGYFTGGFFIKSGILLLVMFGALSGCASLFQNRKFAVDKNVEFKKDVAAPLKGDVYFPLDGDSHPAVVVVHGGGWDHRSGDMESICEDLAQAGYVAFNITYRLAPTDLYPKAVDDVKAAIHWLQENSARYQADPKKMAVWGYSAGAHLALLASLDTNIGIRAIVVGGTPADLTRWPDSELVRKFLGASYQERPDLWREASPIFHVTENSPPVYLYHGEWDQIVEPEQVSYMTEALKTKNRPYEVHIVPYMGHVAVYLLSHESIDLGIQFLNKTLSP